jgi:hypothetical protein
MRWLMLMVCATGLLGCVSQRLVRCDARLHPINAPASKAKQDESAMVAPPPTAVTRED